MIKMINFTFEYFCPIVLVDKTSHNRRSNDCTIFTRIRYRGWFDRGHRCTERFCSVSGGKEEPPLYHRTDLYYLRWRLHLCRSDRFRNGYIHQPHPIAIGSMGWGRVSFFLWVGIFSFCPEGWGPGYKRPGGAVIESRHYHYPGRYPTQPAFLFRYCYSPGQREQPVSRAKSTIFLDWSRFRFYFMVYQPEPWGTDACSSFPETNSLADS